MFRIEARHLDGLGDMRERRFETRLVDFLREEYEDAAADDPASVGAEVRVMVAKARSYGFETEAEQAVYVNTGWLLGADFDTEFPAAAEVLTNESIPAVAKSAWLRQWTIALFEELEVD